MSKPVPRTCTEVSQGDTGKGREAESRPLQEFRDASAYVLLGDPGAGKTTAFKVECDALGDDARRLSARDFLTVELREPSEWREKTLFIDGLDEVRAGSTDVRTPFDTIRRKLDALGRPRFRLSCREADWLGANDRTHLKRVSPDSRVALLRLDPLADRDIERILDSHPDVDDATQFMAAAKQNGVDGFLRNPQSLDLLARAVGDVGSAGSWPTSRRELFETACRRIVHECNLEHVAATRSSIGAMRPSVEDLLDAAGHLCAVQLVADAAGFAVTGDAERKDFPDIDRWRQRWNGTRAPDQHADEGGQLFRAVLATKLFTAHSTDRFSPIHRHVAEFLGGRYLARRIEGGTGSARSARGGLPVRRVVAVVTGGDDMVVTELRGLSAWLAAHCRIARNLLIERDPIGVGLYGDVSQFSTEERMALLASLQVQASRLAPAHQTAAAFRPLATPEMMEAFNGILTDSSRAHEHQIFVYFLVCLLAQSPPLPVLADALLTVIRDETRLPDIKATALDAFIRHAVDTSEKTRELKVLLADVHAGRISDPHDELLGTLLTQLYPEELPPAEVWTYLAESPNPLYGGRYFRFWRRLVDESAPPAIAVHLDALAAGQDTLWPALESHGLQDVPLRLLARGLESFGDEIDTKRLYDWLGAGLISDLRRLPDESPGRVRRWLGERPVVQKAMFAEGLARRTGFEDTAFRRDLNDVERRLYGADGPSDFGPWFLEQAEKASDRRVAEYFLEHAINAVRARTNGGEFSLNRLAQRVEKRDALAEIYQDLQARDRATDAAAQRYLQRAQRYAAQEKREHQKKADYVRAHEAALRANRCRPDLLNQLAAAYLGLLTDAEGDTPADRLRNLFGDDEGLTQAALAGLRDAILRDDLPDLDEIIRLREESHEHYLALPVLASLEELNRTDLPSLNQLNSKRPNELRRLETDRVRTALAFYYCTLGLSRPGWYENVLGSRPELVADVLMQTATSEIRGGREHVPGLLDLACDPDHTDVARIASLPLLRGFPIRCAARQMTDLRHLLWSALQHADQDALLDLVERKLTRPSMDVAQRGHWLAAGLLLSPEAYLQRSEKFATGSEPRTRHLFALFGDQPLQAFPMDRLGLPVLQLVVRLAGRTFRPRSNHSIGQVVEITPEMSAAERVQWMIRSLAELPTEDAGAALETLASDDGLSTWRAELIRARDRQRAIRRDATFRHPDVEQVGRTLNDGVPANAGDLAALVADRVAEIADRIRNGNTDDWRQYWNEDSHGRPVAPKPEDSCRDALLSDLQQRLPADVDAHREGQYANERRADIRVAYRNFNVPIEIKKNRHPDLWSALHDQLIAQYVRDPGTDGYGIYLVLWFGEIDGNRTPLPPSGARPNVPDALRARLEAILTPGEARKIAISVIDVTPYAAKSRTSSA